MRTVDFISRMRTLNFISRMRTLDFFTRMRTLDFFHTHAHTTFFHVHPRFFPRMHILNFYHVLLKFRMCMRNEKNNSMRMCDLSIRKSCFKEKRQEPYELFEIKDL